MSYAIGSFVFGINLKDHIKSTSDQVRFDIEMLTEIDLVSTEYSGNGEMPVYIGVPISNIDECNDLSWAVLTKLKNKFKNAMTPGSKERLELQTKIDLILSDDEVSNETKAFISQFEPEVFLTWGSS